MSATIYIYIHEVLDLRSPVFTGLQVLLPLPAWLGSCLTTSMKMWVLGKPGAGRVHLTSVNRDSTSSSEAAGPVRRSPLHDSLSR